MAHQGYGIPNQKVEGKLRSVLLQLLNVDFKINDDTCLEKLLTHLSQQGGSAYLRSVCYEWVEQILQLAQPEVAVVSFALRLVALIVDSESGFKSLQAGNVVVRLCQLTKNGKLEDEIPVTVAYIALLSSLAKHSPGCSLIIEYAWWQDVVQLCVESRSIYATRDSRNFVTAFLTGPGQRATVCEMLLQRLLDAGCLATLTHVLEASLVADHPSVPQALLGPLDLTGWLRARPLTEPVARLAMLVCFATFKRDKAVRIREETVTAADLRELEKKVFRLFSLLVANKDFSAIFKVSVYGHITWKKIFTELRNSEQSTYFFENQLMSLQLIPVFVNMATRAADNECLDHYCNKLFALTNEETQRVCYSFREHLLNMDSKQDMALQAILSIQQLEHVIQRDRAVVVFQALMYTLKDFVPDTQLSPGAVGSDNVTRYPHLLAVTLQSLTSLIQLYSISWRESVETICLFGYTQDLLKDPNLTPKLNVLGLKLIQVAITKFMPPNLALLMDTLQGSTLDQIGPLLFRKLHDRHWEVRDSALEVLQVVSALANIKFPAFQEHVIEHKLCSLTVTLACDDGESYVRASSLKCVGMMVKVRAFWESCLSTQDLPRRVIAILQQESEGVVRKEAAALMKEIYQHHSFPKAVMREVYRTMSEAVTKDLYWEVEVNALGFWERVIEQQMGNQGMIDGVFPSVTFSKEHRKIVTLTPDEIRARLCKALRELDQLGCLHVLLTALEDCDLKVVQKAAGILQRLAGVMARYDVIPPSEAHGSVPPPSSKPILDTFGFDNYHTLSINIPLQSEAMEADLESGTDELGFTDFRSPDQDLPGHKRKLNSESVAGSSESDELGFPDFLMEDNTLVAAEVNNSVAEVSPRRPDNKKPVKIFKIDNLDSQSGDANVNLPLNNLRDRTANDLACIPLEFNAGSFVSNDIAARNGKTNNVDASNGEPLPRYRDELFSDGSFDFNVSNDFAAKNNITNNVDASNGEPLLRYRDELFPDGSFDFSASNGKANNVDASNGERYMDKPSNLRTPKMDNNVANAASRPISSDQVIEDIVKLTDMNLLASVYHSQMSMGDPAPVTPQPSVSSEEFLARLSGLKLNEILAERDRWLTQCGNDLDSLLDDILACNENNESRALDCY